jgi:hypothetical protein
MRSATQRGNPLLFCYGELPLRQLEKTGIVVRKLFLLNGPAKILE